MKITKGTMRTMSVYMYMLILLICICHVACSGYFKECPKGLLHRRVAQTFCSNKEDFHCLPAYSQHRILLGFIYLCRTPIVLPNCTYPVYYRNIVTGFSCPPNRYQDKWYQSNETNMFLCSKEKTNCTEEGQKTHFVNSRMLNNLCFCAEGYILVERSSNGTFCRPETEDCSCVRITIKTVPMNNHVTDPVGVDVTNPTKDVDGPKPIKAHMHDRENGQQPKAVSSTFYPKIAVMCLFIFSTFVAIIKIIGCNFEKVKIWFVRVVCRRNSNTNKTDDSIASTTEGENDDEYSVIDTQIADNHLSHTTNPCVTQPTQEGSRNEFRNTSDCNSVVSDDIPVSNPGTIPTTSKTIPDGDVI